MGFRRNGFSFEPRDTILKNGSFLQGISLLFSRTSEMLLNIGFSPEFSTRAQILKNGFSKKWGFLSAFWERKLEKWLTIFARTYCIPFKTMQLASKCWKRQAVLGVNKKETTQTSSPHKDIRVQHQQFNEGSVAFPSQISGKTRSFQLKFARFCLLDSYLALFRLYFQK